MGVRRCGLCLDPMTRNDSGTDVRIGGDPSYPYGPARAITVCMPCLNKIRLTLDMLKPGAM
jgi:hypothetical protein